ncbi:glycosyltransferase family 2 protein [Falsiroseomonas ponticola]|uniref:glycosyltransferase family 2 protein n=1 Tax=Falsiroseomonas ponticola TaxID=2786951 RepID=UPI001932BC14|nr:glycosyltransferase family 2 protein [Roseomonas ponticola]
MMMIYRCVCYPRTGTWDSLNLDLDEKNILFHVSVRPDRRQIVVNELVDGAWGLERTVPVDLSATEVLPLVVICTPAHIHLLVAGEVRATVAVQWPEGRQVSVRSSMAWFATPPFPPFAGAADAPGAAARPGWLPGEGIGAEALRGFVAAPGWQGGPVAITIGAERFTAQAMPAPSAPGLPAGFVVPLDPAARDALAQAEAHARLATRVTIDFSRDPAAPIMAEGWVNPPGVVEGVAEGRITGWVRARGAAPRLDLLLDGVPVQAQVALGAEPRFPRDSLLGAPRARDGGGDGYAPERRSAFTIDVPAEVLARARASGATLQVMGDGAKLVGGSLAFGARAPAAEAAAAAPPAPEAVEETVASGQRGGAVQVLRMDVPPASGEDVWLDLVAPNGDIPLHLRYRAAENWIVTNHCTAGEWGSETVLGRLPSSWYRLLVDVEIGAGRCIIAVNHQPWGAVTSELLGSEELTVRGPHQRFARAAPRTAPPPPWPVPPCGAVDRILRDAVMGWAADAPPEAMLEIDIGEGPVRIAPRWVELPGLAARLGRPGARLGFEAPLPEALRGRLGRHARLARLSLDGRPLSLPPAWGSAVTEVDGFVLRGEVVGTPAGRTPRLGLMVGGRAREVASVVWAEQPLPGLRAGGGSQARHGFEIELPGTIWTDAARTEGAVARDVTLEVTVDGRVIDPGRLLFTRGMAQHALLRAAQAGDASPAAQCNALLAAEHLAFGRFLPDLPAEAARFHRDFVRRMKLDAFLARQAPAQPGPAAPGQAAPDPTAEDSQRIAVWRALRAVNARLTAEGEPIFYHARLVEAAERLEGEAREHFWFGLVPTLCVTDELPLLGRAVPLATWFHHEERPDGWALSSVIALLAAAGEARRATDALYKLAGSMQGWINTACIGFALRHLEGRAAEGLLAEAELERFRYAFLALLDAFKGEWFSRLHDRHLVEALVLLMDRRRLMPDYLAQDMVRAALRHYGLSPAFWSRWQGGPARREAGPDTLLAVAHRRFRQLEAALGDPARVDQRLGTLHAALQFFRGHGNPEAVIWQRELAAHGLRPGSTANPGTLGRLLADLVTIDQRDAVRIAAMPGLAAPGGLAGLGIAAEGVRDLLREMRPQPRGMTDHAQRALCRLLTAPEMPPAAAEARELAGMLADPRYQQVGADMLSLMAVRQAAVQHPGAAPIGRALVRRFAAAMTRAVEEGGAPHLPAPLLAGLSRLLHVLEGQRLPEMAEAVTALQALKDAIHLRFRHLHDEALTPVARPAIAFDPAALAGDVLVCVYSCNKYLDSRVAAIRETWMQDLAAIGARCIVIVGDGDDRLDGDVLRLAVSDSYEDLPQKTLRMVEWVHANTDAQYLIKIDDDCYLSTENYFGTLDYRAHHYHGRVLERAIGGTDRAWHHLKSSSDRARSIDRSPEPSRYCDGGGVYCLSRFAMGRLVAAAARREGQRLVARSFMEDKLVGDLLAMEEIFPDNTDYESYQRRRTFGTAHPIGIYENTFFPSALGPARVAHLDLDRDQARAHALRGQLDLSPKKLWPSFASVGTDHTHHQLELLSDGEVLARAQAEPVGVVLAARNEMTMLPHLLDHYRSIGVRAFYAVDNASDDGSREWLLAQPDVVVYSAAGEYRTSHYGVTWQQTVLAHHFVSRWAVVADADEFLIYPGWRNRGLMELIAAVEAERANAVPLWMVDMYPAGPLEEADFAARPPFEAATWLDREPVHAFRLTSCFYSNRCQQVSALRHRLLPDSEPNGFVAEKVALFRYQPWIRVSEGIHSAANVRLSRQPAVFAHFKYHAGFRRKILEEISRGQHYNGAAEYKRYAAMVAESAGAFGQEGLSVQLGADGFLPPESRGR